MIDHQDPATADAAPLTGRRAAVVAVLDRAIAELPVLPPRRVPIYLRKLELDLTADAGTEKPLRAAALRLRMFRTHWPHRPDPKTDQTAAHLWDLDMLAMATVDLPRIRDAIATHDRSRLNPARLGQCSRRATKPAAERRTRRVSR